ncbi:MAG: TetR/AcrR family transcriptional regulator [Myxococcales bacterium]|nr:TetR/AcrR family transcriptional regulator [Myxococcales bacterium]
MAEIRKRDAERSKRLLMKAAELEFAEKGFDAARVDDIARHAGVNKGLIYLYFGKKEDLYLEVLKDNLRQLLQASRSLIRKSDDPYEQTIILLRNFFDFLVENPAFVRLLAWESLQGGQWSRGNLVNLLSEGLSELIRSLERGIELGVFRRDLNARQLVLSVVGLCMTYFQRRLLMAALWTEDLRRPEVRDRVLRHILQPMFEGILAKPSQAPDFTGEIR